MRNPDARIHWFLTHHPVAVGMCLNHTWRATDIPPAGAADANEAWQYTKEAGKLRTDRNPPRGAWVYYSSPTHGHAALALGDRMIASTDVHGPATTGRVPMSYPETQWGHRYVGWTDWYGQTFTVDSKDDDMPLSEDDVRRLAKAVWEYEFENESTDPRGKRPARWFLNTILSKVKNLK